MRINADLNFRPALIKYVRSNGMFRVALDRSQDLRHSVRDLCPARHGALKTRGVAYFAQHPQLPGEPAADFTKWYSRRPTISRDTVPRAKLVNIVELTIRLRERSDASE